MILHRKVCSTVKNLLRAPNRTTQETHAHSQPATTPSCTALDMELLSNALQETIVSPAAEHTASPLVDQASLLPAAEHTASPLVDQASLLPAAEHTASPLVDQTPILPDEDQLPFPAVGAQGDHSVPRISHKELHNCKDAKEQEWTARPCPERLHSKGDIDAACATLNSAGKPLKMELMVILYIICRMRQIWDLSPAGNGPVNLCLVEAYHVVMVTEPGTIQHGEAFDNLPFPGGHALATIGNQLTSILRLLNVAFGSPLVSLSVQPQRRQAKRNQERQLQGTNTLHPKGSAGVLANPQLTSKMTGVLMRILLELAAYPDILMALASTAALDDYVLVPCLMPEVKEALERWHAEFYNVTTAAQRKSEMKKEIIGRGKNKEQPAAKPLMQNMRKAEPKLDAQHQNSALQHRERDMRCHVEWEDRCWQIWVAAGEIMEYFNN